MGARTSAFLTYAFNSIVTYIPLRHVRVAWLRLLGADCPSSVSLFRGVTVYGAPKLRLGERVSIGYNACLDARGGISIDHDSVIASFCHLLTADHDVDSSEFSGRVAPIQIGHHCWICTRAIILKGSSLGDYCVVACNSVVTKSFEGMVVVGGIPAKYIRARMCDSDYQIPLHCDPEQP